MRDLSMRNILSVLLFLSVSFAFAGTNRQDSIVGVASYYANSMHGRRTANGEKYDKNKYTCAHRTFGFGTKLRVRHLASGREVVVRVTDRGPFNKRYTIDLSYAAAKDLGIINAGHAKVVIFPYDEQQEEQKQEDLFPGFMEFAPVKPPFPSIVIKDIITTSPTLLPIPGPRRK